MERREEGEEREGTDSTRLDLLVCPHLVKTLTHGLVFNPKSLFVLFDPKILLGPICKYSQSHSGANLVSLGKDRIIPKKEMIDSSFIYILITNCVYIFIISLIYLYPQKLNMWYFPVEACL